MGRSRTILILSLLLSSAPWTSVAEEALIAVASNFNAPAQALIRRFERSTDHTLRLSQGSSGKLFAQVRNGAPFDVFLSADQALPATLVQQGRAVAGSQFTYPPRALALWSEEAGLALGEHTLETLADASSAPTLGKIAMANPRIAPYGLAAQQALESAGRDAGSSDEWLAAQIVYGENISQTFQFVATGNARIGFVALSQVLALEASRRGTYWRVPSVLHAPIRQDAVLLSRAEGNAAAREFLHFLRGDEARAVIEGYGYELEASSETQQDTHDG